jgi:hypothetical protein
VEYLCGELSKEKGRRVAYHLEACPDCRKVGEGMKMAADAVKGLPLPEPPAAFWDFYAGRVMKRISETRTRRHFGNLYGYKKFLLPSLSVLLFFSIFLGSTNFYQVNREIEKHRELLQNVETIWNLDLVEDLVEQLNQGNVLFSEPLDQPYQAETTALSKGDIWRRFHKFQQLPVSEQKLILANYQKWTGYPKPRQVTSKRIYCILKTADHPALKRLE